MSGRLLDVIGEGFMTTKFAAAIVIGLLAMSVAGAEESARPQEAAEPPEPSIGDIMQQQQMRHIKLWFAGRAGNWPLAAYEIDKLKDGFDAVNSLIGGDTVKAAVGDPLGAIKGAIDDKDRAAFARGFDQLTAGCNSC